MIQTGDLIGVGSPTNAFGQAIVASGQRQTTTTFDHIGVLEVAADKIWVWNANPKLGVVRESLQDFKAREGEREFAYFRLQIPVEWNFDWMTAQLGKPYNHTFIASDAAYYCADFVARAASDGVFDFVPMQFVGDFWQAYYAKYNLPVPHGALGVHPNDMLAQGNVVRLDDN